MRYTYNKLVRDKIPQNIEKQPGRIPKWRVMDEEEYAKELNRKLVEEAYEFIEKNSEEELADVIEVLESIIELKNISMDNVRKLQETKKEKKGGFKDRIYLEYVDEKERNLEMEKELNKDYRKKI